MSHQLKIEEYSQKAFVVRGNTTQHKDQLLVMNGKWNPNLTGGPGWIFSWRHIDKLKVFISELNKENKENKSLESLDSIETLATLATMETLATIETKHNFLPVKEVKCRRTKSKNVNTILQFYDKRYCEMKAELKAKLEAEMKSELEEELEARLKLEEKLKAKLKAKLEAKNQIRSEYQETIVKYKQPKKINLNYIFLFSLFTLVNFVYLFFVMSQKIGLKNSTNLISTDRVFLRNITNY